MLQLPSYYILLLQYLSDYNPLLQHIFDYMPLVATHPCCNSPHFSTTHLYCNTVPIIICLYYNTYLLQNYSCWSLLLQQAHATMHLLLPRDFDATTTFLQGTFITISYGTILYRNRNHGYIIMLIYYHMGGM